MSIVTKIFVVLLVVLSLLLSAATVTFVNTVNEYKSTADAQTLKLQNDAARASEQQALYEGQLARAQEQIGTLETQIATLNAQIAASGQQLATRGAEVAQVRQDLTMSKADVNRLTSAVQAATAASTAKDELLATLRGEQDKLLTQVGDLNVALSDTTNRLSVTEAQRRLLAEQLTEARNRADQFGAALRDRGVDPDRLAGATGIAAGAPPINGVVRSTVNIAGVDYATISVGSEDAVKPNMEFNIVDTGSGAFLGKLTIVEVRENEAIGRIVAPDAAAVRSGSVVRTQL